MINARLQHFYVQAIVPDFDRRWKVNLYRGSKFMKKYLFILLLPCALFGQSGIVGSALPTATSLNAADYSFLIQSSTTKKFALSTLRGYLDTAYVRKNIKQYIAGKMVFQDSVTFRKNVLNNGAVTFTSVGTLQLPEVTSAAEGTIAYNSTIDRIFIKNIGGDEDTLAVVEKDNLFKKINTFDSLAIFNDSIKLANKWYDFPADYRANSVLWDSAGTGVLKWTPIDSVFTIPDTSANYVWTGFHQFMHDSIGFNGRLYVFPADYDSSANGSFLYDRLNNGFLEWLSRDSLNLGGGSANGWTLSGTTPNKIYQNSGIKTHIRSAAGDTTGTALLNVYGTSAFSGLATLESGIAIGKAGSGGYDGTITFYREDQTGSTELNPTHTSSTVGINLPALPGKIALKEIAGV